MALENVGGSEQTQGISRLTTEYLYWPVTTDHDLSEADVYVAFTEDATTKPGSEDWTLADLVENPDNAAQDAVRLLIGPDGDEDLTPGTDAQIQYRVWIRFEVGNEKIVRRAGTLTVR